MHGAQAAEEFARNGLAHLITVTHRDSEAQVRLAESTAALQRLYSVDS